MRRRADKTTTRRLENNTPLKLFRFFTLGIALLGGFLLVLIALNLSHNELFQLKRFRETTWVIHGAIILFVLARYNRVSFLRVIRKQAIQRLTSPVFFPVMAASFLALYCLTTVTQHLAFRTFTHDFSMIDEALYSTYTGKFMYSPVLGKSFFAEHFSPILLLLIPFHWFFKHPLFLTIIQAIALWSSVVVLQRILTYEGISIALTNVICLLFLNHPIMIKTLSFLFHMECFLPLAIFSLYLCYRKNNQWGYWLSMLFSLSIKEEIGLYLVGFAAYIAIKDRHYKQALFTALIAITWTGLSVSVIIPSYNEGMAEYRFITRWQEWGTTPLTILSGFIQHPLKFAMSLFRKSIVLHFVRLGTLPFWDYKGILLFIVPWVINATSRFSQQANMSLYYGIPMFSFACVAAIRGFKSAFFKNFQKRQWSFLFVWGLMMLNVAHYVFPEIPSARNDILKQIERIPKDASVQAMSCFFSVLGYERQKEMITATSDLHSDYILVRTQMTTWPLSEQESELVVAQCRENQAYDIFYQIDDFVICKRKERFH